MSNSNQHRESKPDLLPSKQAESYELNGSAVHDSTSRVKADHGESPAPQPMVAKIQPSGNVEHFIEVVRQSRFREKLIFLISVVSLIVVAYSVLFVHWLLPYYYVISAPLLVGLRVALYIKYKYQYFLIDFCYFGNALVYIYMWAAPWHPELFLVVFGLTNGPMACATIIFRNSLVFHSVDKMTSVYIHILPFLLSFVLRWYPVQLSEHWYTEFVQSFNVDTGYIVTWIVGVAFASFAFHTVLYLIMVYAICRPDSSYLNSYRYLSNKDSWISSVLNFFGQKYSFGMFSLFNWLYCAISLLVAVVCYKFFAAHCVYVCTICLCVVWNGAVYYVDVFAVKGFSET